MPLISETPNLDTLRSATPSSIFFHSSSESQKDTTLLEGAIDEAARVKALEEAFSRVAAADHHIGNTPLFMARTRYYKYNCAATKTRVEGLAAAVAVREALADLEDAEQHLEAAKQRTERALEAANKAQESAQRACALAFCHQAELHHAEKEMRNPGETQRANVHFVMSRCEHFTNGDVRGFLMNYGVDTWIDRGQQGSLHVGVTLHEGVEVLDMFKALVACVPNAMPYS